MKETKPMKETIVQESEDESQTKHKLRSGDTISLAQLREDYSMLCHILNKYLCDRYHIQLRTGTCSMMESAWLRRRIHTADILDVLWDEWGKGKAVEVE